MTITSMGLNTDMIFWRPVSTVTDRGEYIVIETPGSPGWYWGNLLIFDRAPTDEDFERWTELFRREFAHEPRIRHLLFAWNSGAERTPVPQRFLDAGYEPDFDVILMAREVIPPPHPNGEIAIRAIETEEDWQEVVRNQVECRDERFPEESYTGFVWKRIGEYRALIAEGRGEWYGAFIGERLVGSLGIFREGDLARFQVVCTAPDYRRRGICGTMVYEISRAALKRPETTRLVMAADESYHAARIYESVGFRPLERSESLLLYPENERRPADVHDVPT